jgi:hypothetical protein
MVHIGFNPDVRRDVERTQYSVPSTQYLVHGRGVAGCLYLFLFVLATLLGTSLPPHACGQQPSTSPAGHLPWEPPPRATEPVLRPPAGPDEILARFDIGPSQLESFFSGQELSPSEEDVLVKVLYRFPSLGLDNLLRWRQHGIGWDQLAAAPAEHRAKVFHLAGRAKRVKKRQLLPEQVELYEFDHYYLVTLALVGSPYEALIAARRVPDGWPVDSPLDESAQVDALFLKVGDAMADPPQLVFAAVRVGWYPDRPSAEHHIGPSQLALAKLGMDVSLWDDVRDSKDKALTAADREGFYQLLAAVGRPEARQLRSSAGAELDIVPLLEKPAEHFGEVGPVEGLARRVMKVPVNDADIRSRFGIDHYYEVDLFVSLGDASLRLGKDATGEKNPVYRNAFPATLIVRELPVGLPEGENIHERIRAEGVFFKIWTYKSSYTTRFGQLQPAPLFIAARPQVIHFQNSTNWLTGTLVIGALTLALGVTAIIVWWYGRSDREAPMKSAQRMPAPPDFSRLS